MVKFHLKRINAPKSWTILRKTDKFISLPKPGAHKKALGTSLNTFLKEMLKIAKTSKETKYILTKQEVQVNGTRKRDHKDMVGFLDIITIPSINKNYTLIIGKNGALTQKELTAEEAKHTIQRVTGKTTVRGGKIQIQTMNGKNFLLDSKEAKSYKTGDTIVISIKDNKITEHISLEKGVIGLIFEGKHAGKHGKVEEITNDTITLKSEKEKTETKKAYVLVLGKTKPLMNLEA